MERVDGGLEMLSVPVLLVSFKETFVSVNNFDGGDGNPNVLY